MGRNQDTVLVSPTSIPLIFLILISVCTAQYAELGLIFIMPFVGIRIILVLRLSFAVSKPKEILSLSTGDHALFFLIHPLILPHTTLTIPPSREGELEVWDEKEEKKNGR